MSRPYPTHPLCAASKLRARCGRRALCCQQAPCHRHPRVIAKLCALPPTSRVLPVSSSPRRSMPLMSSALATYVATSFVLASSSMSTSLDSAKQQEDVALKAHVANVCFKRFRCFHMHVARVSCGCCICCHGYIHMLQVYCFKCFSCFRRMLHVFYVVLRMFHTYVVSVSSGCGICFTYMLQVFHLDVAYVLQWLRTCFSGVSDVCCKCFNCFVYMLQLFHLDVTKVDLVLHML
jgi:hypothetical protein